MEALAKIRDLPITCMNDLVSIGQVIAGTRLFGCPNPQDGFIIAAICHQEGWTYAHFTQTYHFIAGKIAKRADAIQAAFQEAGGNIEIKKRDGDGSIILLSFGETRYESKCLWEEIKEEAFTKERDGKTYKENYSTPRRRMQMMWARAISDGVRTVYPAACQGTYTVEEVSDFSDDEVTGGSTTEKTVSAEDVRKRAGKIKPQGVVQIDTNNQAGCVQVSPPPYSADKEAKPEQAQTVQQQQQVQPQQQQQAQQPMTPFNYAERAAQDFSLCPIPGPAYRMPWDSMSNDNLKAALELGSPQYPEMDNAGHKQAIQAILELRAANGTVK